MRRKYAALMLGLALTISSITAYAEAPDITESIETEMNSNAEEIHNEIYGEITEVTDDSITLSTGTWEDAENVTLDEAFTLEETPEDSKNPENAEEDSTDATSVSADESNESADNDIDDESDNSIDDSTNTKDNTDTLSDINGMANIFILDGEEQTITLTEDTQFLREGSPILTEESDLEDTEVSDTDAKSDETVADVSDDEITADTTADDVADDEITSDTTADDVADDVFSTTLPSNIEPLETIAHSDLQTGDIVKITLDEDGNAATVTVVMSYDEINPEDGEFGIEEIELIDEASKEETDSVSDEADASETTAE